MRSTFYLLFIFLFTLFSFGCSEREQVQVQKKNLVQGVYASGNVVPVGYYEVTANVSGFVDQIYVSIGQEVTAGTPLVKLKNEPTEANLRIARNQLELARKNADPDSDLLKQLAQQLENARSAFEQDSIEVERFARLLQDSIGTRQDLERAELRYRTSQNNYRIAESKLQETRDRLQIELDNAINHYRAQESMTGDYTLLSVTDGKVYDIIPKDGELIAGNRPIMMIGASARFETELQVDETDIVLVKEGQPVYFELDAIEGRMLNGVVTQIYPRINTIERTAKVIASIDPMEYPLYPGMALEANIVVREKEDVLVVPVTFISRENEVVLEDESRKRVETGIRDLNYVEILSGLSEGDVLLKPEP